jgi:hypothetical protein
MIRNLAVDTQKGGGKDSFQKPTDPLFGGRVPHRDRDDDLNRLGEQVEAELVGLTRGTLRFAAIRVTTC